MEITLNLDNIVNFVNSEDFAQYLLANTTDFGTAAWVLQTLLDALENLVDNQ